MEPTPDSAGGTRAAPSVDAAKITLQSRILAAYWGLFIGDALAAPSHFYYKLDLLKRDYTEICDFMRPRNPHPESTLFRTRYEPANEKGEILHEQKQYYGKPGIHFHQHLTRGENTLNAQLARVLIESLVENQGYDADDYLARYIDFMRTPGKHRDTYIEDAHREFFMNYANGREPRRCANESNQIGGLTLAAPLAIFYYRDDTRAKEAIREHLSLTHKGANIARPGELLAELLHFTLQGSTLERSLFKHMDRSTYQSLSYPIRRWSEKKGKDSDIVGKEVTSGAQVDEAMPATLYLAYKYRDNFEAAQIANANLGGDSCARGALLGVMLGSTNGCEDIPGRWVSKLYNYEALDALGDRFLEAITS